MAGRKPSPEHQKALDLFLDSDGEMPLIKIAEQVGKSFSQIRKWKSTNKWDDLLEDHLKGNVTISKGNVTKSGVPEERGTSPPRKKLRESGEKEPDDAVSLDLTDKEALFVEEYLIDLNATQAAIRVGYSQKTAGQIGYQLLQKPSVLTRVREKQEQISVKTDTAQQWVVDKLKLVLERCMQAEPVLDFEGNETGEWKFDSFGATKSLELIGKHIGMFVDPHRRRVEQQKLQIELSRLQLERERLEIDRAKAKLDQNDDKEIVVSLPPRPEVNQDGS